MKRNYAPFLKGDLPTGAPPQPRTRKEGVDVKKGKHEAEMMFDDGPDGIPVLDLTDSPARVVQHDTDVCMAYAEEGPTPQQKEEA